MNKEINKLHHKITVLDRINETLYLTGLVRIDPTKMITGLVFKVFNREGLSEGENYRSSVLSLSELIKLRNLLNEKIETMSTIENMEPNDWKF